MAATESKSDQWSGKALRRDGLRSTGVRLANVGLGMLAMVLLARCLGGEGYGIYSYVMALVTVLAVPAKFGLPQLVVREVALARAREQWGRVRGIWRWANIGSVSASVILISAGLITAWALRDRIAAASLSTFVWGMAVAAFSALGILRGAALRGMGRVILGQMPEQIILPSLFALLLGVWILGSMFFPDWTVLTPAKGMAIHVLAAVITFVIGMVMIRRTFPDAVRQARPEYDHRAWLISVLPLAMTACMQLINKNMDIIMLGLFRPVEEVGLYKVAGTFALYVTFGMTAINQVQGPRFARMFAKGEMVKLQAAAVSGSQMILMVMLPVTVVLVLFGRPILRGMLGEAFVPAYLPMVILCMAHVVHGMVGSAGLLLNMTGHERQTAKVVGLGAGLNILFNAALIPFFGMMGAAVATALSTAIWNLLAWRAVRAKLGINSAAVLSINWRRR